MRALAIAVCLSMTACHDTFTSPPSGAKSKTPIDFGFDLSTAALAGDLATASDLSASVDLATEDLAHIDLAHVDLDDHDQR